MGCSKSIAAVVLSVGWLGCAARQGGESEPVDSPLAVLLAYYDKHYDSARQMLRVEFSSSGYHSKISPGAQVHPTRESLIYALALLQRGAVDDVDRATAIVRRILRLQDVDPTSPTCGIWPWHLEEPLKEMAAPDFNWADFCGVQIAHVLVEHSDQLTPDLDRDMRRSLRHAAEAIRRRNVGPGYTKHRRSRRGRLRSGWRVARRSRASRLRSPPASEGRRTDRSTWKFQRVQQSALSEGRDRRMRADARDRRGSGNTPSGRVVATHGMENRGRQLPPGHESIGRSDQPHVSRSPPRHHGGFYFAANRLSDSDAPVDDRGQTTWVRGRFRFALSQRMGRQVPFASRSASPTATHVHPRQVGSRFDDRHDLAGGQGLSWQCEPIEFLDAAEAADRVLENGAGSGRGISGCGSCTTGRTSPRWGSARYRKGRKVRSRSSNPSRNRGDWHRTLDRPADGVFHATDFRLRSSERASWSSPR